jgi:hypothetical protein
VTLRVRGGLRVRWGNATWPLASLECSSDHLRISSLIARFTVDRNNIDVITAYRGLFSKGIRIFMKDEGRFGEPIFWYQRNDRLLDQLAVAGWLSNHPRTCTAVNSPAIPESEAPAGGMFLISPSWCGPSRAADAGRRSPAGRGAPRSGALIHKQAIRPYFSWPRCPVAGDAVPPDALRCRR